MKLLEVYSSYSEDSQAGEDSRLLLAQAHWYGSIAKFDPKTGEALPRPLSEVLRSAAAVTLENPIRDRLWVLVEHSRLSLERLFNALAESPRREQAYLPIRAVRELDASSFIALSRRPGRNIREKLADKPYMQATRRFQSIDIPENQLIKAYATRIAELLELRKRFLKDEDYLLQKIYKWLSQDEIKEISPWGNLPPNNALLSHRDYRRIWNSWRWLQTLDDDINQDFLKSNKRKLVIESWSKWAEIYESGTLLFAEMPVLFNYETFDVTPWITKFPTHKAGMLDRSNPERETVNNPVCVDFSCLHPNYAVGNQGFNLPEAFIWQRWEKDEDRVDIELFDADAVCLHPNATTITASNLLFPSDINTELLGLAARSFTQELNKHFKNDTLLWLSPDSLNDFELELARRNVNARFSNAEPLPRSVAAVIDNIDYSEIKGDGFSAVVVESMGGKQSATELIARYDKELEERLSETHGFIWERCAPVITRNDSQTNNDLFAFPTVEEDGHWHTAIGLESCPHTFSIGIKTSANIKEHKLYKTVESSPVCGGIRLWEMQKRAGDIPLWRNHIPELSIKVLVKGRYQPFYLVDMDVTVSPVRGEPVTIPVKEIFTLPAGQAYYRFPLFQGADEDALEYEARLESPNLPLASDLACRLNMTYTYGADNPYRLVFEPIDKSIPPIVTKWQPKSEVIITDAPAPGYPEPTNWNELQRQYDPVKNRTTDFLEWASDKTDTLLQRLGQFSGERIKGALKTDWKMNDKGFHYAFVTYGAGEELYIHEKALIDDLDYSTLYKGCEVHFIISDQSGRKKAHCIAVAKADVNRSLTLDICTFIHRALYVPYIRVWADGRSIQDSECPSSFRDKLSKQLPHLCQCLASRSVPKEVKGEIRFLICCMHKDMPDSAIKTIKENDSSDNRDEKSVGFSLGDLSRQWQVDIFRHLVKTESESSLRIFAHAIWRDKNFVTAFAPNDLRLVTNYLLKKIQEHDSKLKSNLKLPNQTLGHLIRYLELLLGLLRTRESSDPEIHLFLQPHQEITTEFAKVIESLTDKVIRAKAEVPSRIKLDLSDKPEDDMTPDLLYALRVYLTGDDSAAAIRVTGINDDD
jgi:cold shock CspA family protein